MKKKLIMSAVVLMLSMVTAMAKDAKYYSDSANGYGGIARAEYLGTAETYDLSYYDSGDFIYDIVEGDIKKSFEKQGFVITRQLSKLSKEEVFLIWEAVCEYDVRDGEVYGIFLQCDNSGEYLSLDVEICDTGRSFRYYGGYYFKDK